MLPSKLETRGENSREVCHRLLAPKGHCDVPAQKGRGIGGGCAELEAKAPPSHDAFWGFLRQKESLLALPVLGDCTWTKLCHLGCMVGEGHM